MKIFLLVLLLFIFNDIIFSRNLKSKSPNYIVVGDKINVRKKPNTKSNIVYQLKVAESITVIKKSGIIYKNKKVKGEWIYIQIFLKLEDQKQLKVGL
jgi:uncharacterized protein YgiM (DUF1202 family)